MDIHERKYLKRMRQEEVAQSVALEQRERNFMDIKSINAVNKSIEFEKKRMLEDFQKQVRVNKKLRKIAKTARDHPTVQSLPPIVRDRVYLDS